jgi:arginase family enzyme
VLGLRPPAPGKVPGARRLPEALRRHRLLERLGAADAGRVEPPPYRPDIDPASGVRNGDTLPGYTIALADRLVELLRAGTFPLVLGGDCSILLGGMLALRRLGRYGLVSVDGGAVATLAGRGVEGFWVHVDADVLDPEIMPAVDSPEPGGLTYGELAALLRALTTAELADTVVAGLTRE